jgi:hypothetical protein
MTSLLGLSVRLPNTCRCASDTATIGDANVLICRSCQQRLGVLSTLTADFVQQVASKFGAPEIITIRARQEFPPHSATEQQPALPAESSKS